MLQDYFTTLRSKGLNLTKISRKIIVTEMLRMAACHIKGLMFNLHDLPHFFGTKQNKTKVYYSKILEVYKSGTRGYQQKQPGYWWPFFMN